MTSTIISKVSSILPSKKYKLIIDTNVLLLPGSAGIDIFTELERVLDERVQLCAMKGTVEELQSLIDKKPKKAGKKIKGKDAFNAKLGFILLHKKNVKIISHEEGHVDDAIIAKISKNDYVFTLDKALQKRVREKSAKIISVRQQHLVLLQ
ncbi:MAG: hypothetical protein ACLFNM_02440 [Candidatus Woesearchaeota archaeon]